MYKIYISSAAGYDFTGISCATEDEAKKLCDKYNKQDENPYAQYVYRSQEEKVSNIFYFNGGLYLNRTNNTREFGAVKPSKGLPYVTENIEGILGAKHHSSVYQLSEDFKEAYLIKDNGTVPSPKKVSLSIDLRDKLIQAVKKYKNKQVIPQNKKEESVDAERNNT